MPWDPTELLDELEAVSPFASAPRRDARRARVDDEGIGNEAFSSYSFGEAIDEEEQPFATETEDTTFAGEGDELPSYSDEDTTEWESVADFEDESPGSYETEEENETTFTTDSYTTSNVSDESLDIGEQPYTDQEFEDLEAAAADFRRQIVEIANAELQRWRDNALRSISRGNEVRGEFETDISDEALGTAFDAFELEKPKPAPVTTAAFESAKAVMSEIFRIVNRQTDEKTADPDRSTVTHAWFTQNKPLLEEWYLLTYGEATKTGRTMLKGEALRTRLDAAVVKTQPVVDALRTRDPKQWTGPLGRFYFNRVADLELRAVETTSGSGSPPRVNFGEKPQQVSLDAFFSVVSKQDSQPVEIARGYGGYSLGTAKAGDVFSAAQQDNRVLLWSNGQAVFFMRDGVIYGQSARRFSEDIILGAFVIGAQNALGSAILAQLMVEVALSFTPWGIVWDGVSALEAATRGSWNEAALNLLPGPMLGLASKAKPVRAGVRGLGIAASVATQVAKKSITFIGRGAYQLGGKLLRGFWIVGEAGTTAGKKSYRFFDETGKRWLDVSETTATRYVKCSQCRLTPAGMGAAINGAVDEIVEGLLKSPVYASGGKLLVSRKLLTETVAAYGPAGTHVVENILDTWSSAPNASKLVNESLQIAKNLSRIKDARGYMGAIDIFEDLASRGVATAQGAMYELRWAAAHADDIAALSIPVTRGRWVGKGLDVLKKNGEAIELKSFNFFSPIYTESPGLSVARIVRQVRSRLSYTGVTKVKVIFNTAGTAKMPTAFNQELTAALNDLARETGRPASAISFASWP